MRILIVMGGELGELGDSAATDDRVLCFGREAGNSGVFLFRLAFFRMGTVAGVAGALAETLVLLLFDGVFFSCYLFCLSRVIGILSSESSVEIPSMGIEGLVLLGDGVVLVVISTAACSFSATCGGACWSCSGMCSAC